jgi:hypothetical protein
MNQNFYVNEFFLSKRKHDDSAIDQDSQDAQSNNIEEVIVPKSGLLQFE